MSNLRLFADDALLYREIGSKSDEAALQKDLDALVTWTDTWQMEFNAKKCYVLRISNKTDKFLSKYNIKGTELEVKHSHTYLGVEISDKLSWNNHINTIAHKAHVSLNFVARNLHNCPREIKELAYKTYVRPKTEYASVVWNPFTVKKINRLESVNRRAARFVTGNYERKASVTQMLADLQWNTLKDHRDVADMMMFHKVVYGNVSLKPDLLREKNQGT